MSASPRLLYILPDVAYVAELLPAKQPHSFAVHSFRQVNGNFITEEQLLEDNLQKLLDKLEPGEYQIVLPDFLFTDTIINVKATSEAQVKDYIKSQLLPSLGIDKTTHQVETFVLTEHKGIFKVQLSALEKSLIEPLAQGMTDRALLVSSVVSVSWALKSVISLEPSLSIVQLGEQLYLAQHYIGVDQAMSASVAEAENLVDTVKTLKGAEPSIQTIYLLANDLVAERLRQGLHNTVPLQQLAVFDESAGKMPSYLKQTMEATMRTLNTPDYAIPKFVPEVKKVSVKLVTSPLPSLATLEDSEEETIAAKPQSIEPTVAQNVEVEEEDDEAVVLPSPTGLSASAASIATVSPAASKIVDLTQPAGLAAMGSATGSLTQLAQEAKAEKAADKVIDLTVGPTSIEPAKIDRATLETSTLPPEKPRDPMVSFVSRGPEKTPVGDLAAETNESASLVKSSGPAAQVKVEELAGSVAPAIKPFVSVPNGTTPKSAIQPTVIRNKTDVSELMKLIGIGAISFLITVGIGVGLGLGLLLFTNRQSKPTSVGSAVVSPTPGITAAPSVAPSPTPISTSQVDPAKVKLLVVNATTIPGHAGKIAQTLKTAGFTGIQTGNAKGQYTKGSYLLMKTPDPALLEFIKTKTGLTTLTSQTSVATEDADGKYTAVVVLAE